ncbi:MAG: C10 family peptidase [Anaerolineales bacterium]|nr:C10 family peptidase [Anaerolineales bacterium]
MRRNRFTSTFVLLCLLLLGALLSSASSLPFAQEPPDLSLDEAQVRTAVETWVRSATADARPAATVERMQPYKADGRLVGYIAHLQGGGFCLAGASELLLPVYLYVPAGEYRPEDVGLQFVLGEMAERLRILEALQAARSPELADYREALANRADLWRELIAGRLPEGTQAEAPQAAPNQMELPLASHWSQGSPYNDQCPNLTPGQDERTVTGCTATAIAQVMNYWKWPNSGLGSDSVAYDWRFRTDWDSEPLATDPKLKTNLGGRLEWTSASGGRLRMTGYWDDSVYITAYFANTTPAYRTALDALWSRMTTGSTPVAANFAAATYNWGALQNVHSDPVDDGDSEVAEIMLHVGVAMDTGYGIHGSGSDLWRATLAPEVPMVSYMRYDPDLLYANPLVANDVVTEIQWLRPAPIGGSDANGAGHAWVLFGYNKNVSPWQFKMNMGWNDGTDGWYSLDNVPRDLDLNHNCLVRMAPQGVVGFVGAAAPGDGSPNAPYQNIEEALAEAPNGAALIFKAGSVNTFAAGTLTINKPLTLMGEEATITKP